jgi:HEAT repeat protein
MTSEEQSQETNTEREAAATLSEPERKSTEELFTAALEGEYDGDSAWEAVSVLRLRGTPEVFELAKRHCKSENPKARARGLSVLAQLGAGKPDTERPFMAYGVSLAIEHLHDSDEEVVRCAAWALSHLGTQQAVLSLIALRSHPDSDVRQAVACCIELRKHPEAVSILQALMEDTDEVVRDWATFALGSSDVEKDGVLHYVDSPEIRAALRNRLEDSYEDARREAIWGLALRNDTLGVKLLLNHLESEEWWNGDKSTAQELLDLRLDTPVEEVRDRLRQLLVTPPVAPQASKS